jgi:antitoxin ParD1/3/4
MPTSVSLTPHFQNLTQSLVASGQYNNVSEVVREGLRLVEERERKKKAALRDLRKAVQVGFDQLAKGQYTEFETQSQFSEYLSLAVKRLHAQEIQAKKSARHAA